MACHQQPAMALTTEDPRQLCCSTYYHTNITMHSSSQKPLELTCLSGRAFCHVQGLSEFGKAVIDGSFLQASPISCQSLVQGNGVPLGILPIGDAGGNLPVLLVLHADWAGGGVHDGYWGGACSPWHLQAVKGKFVSHTD